MSDRGYSRWFALRPVTVDNMAVIGTLVYECGHERHLWACEFRDRVFVSGDPLTFCEECSARDGESIPVMAFRACETAHLVRYCPECGCFGNEDSQMHESGGWSGDDRLNACPTLSDDYDFAAAADRILRDKPKPKVLPA